MKRAILVAGVAAVLGALLNGTSRGQDRVWKASADDIKAACRTNWVGTAQELFKKKEGIYAKSLSMLADHKLISKEIASGVFDGFKYSMAADDKSFKILASPNVADRGLWTYMAQNGKKLRLAFGREPTEKDDKAKTALALIDGKGEWQRVDLSVNERQELHIAAEGQWWVGDQRRWKPCGPEGTTEKSSWGDYRIFGGDARLGCLCVRVEGMNDKGFTWNPAQNCMTIVAPKAGCPEFRINDKDVSDNTGQLTVFILLMRPAEKEND